MSMHVHVGMCVDMCAGMCAGMCVGLCVGMCAGMCVGICVGMSIGSPAGISEESLQEPSRVDMRYRLCTDIIMVCTIMAYIVMAHEQPPRSLPGLLRRLPCDGSTPRR